jgi:hypothetical protein
LKSRGTEGSRPPEPLPAASGIMVQPIRSSVVKVLQIA